MTDHINKTNSVHPTGQHEARLFGTWIDSIETGVRERVRDWIEALIEAKLEAAAPARSPAPSAQPRSPCHGLACIPRMAARSSGGAAPPAGLSALHLGRGTGNRRCCFGHGRLPDRASGVILNLVA